MRFGFRGGLPKKGLKEDLLALVLIAVNGFAYVGTVSAADNDLIIGGTDVNTGDPVAESTVLVTDSAGDFICSGSLIASDMVVTAAHCVDAAPNGDLVVVFSLNIDDIKKGNAVPVTGAVQNPKWKGDASTGVDQGDIAILGFTGALPAGYRPAQLASTSTKLTKGESVVLAGYGITNATTQDGAGVLRQVDVAVIKALGKTEEVLDESKGKGACHGDSGGPAFVSVGGTLELWGLTNRGYPDSAPDNCAEQVVYTRISTYSSWIATVEAQLRASK